jgi:hypothetical protein
VNDVPPSLLYDIIKKSSNNDYNVLLELCKTNDTLLSRTDESSRLIIGLLVNSNLFSDVLYDHIRNLNPSAFTSLSADGVLNMFETRKTDFVDKPPYNPDAKSSYLDIIKTIKNDKKLVVELNRNEKYADAIIQFFQSGIHISDQNARDYLQYVMYIFSIFRESLNTRQLEKIIRATLYPKTPAKKLWVGNAVFSLLKKTNIDLNTLSADSWANLCSSSKFPTDIWKEALSSQRKTPDENFAAIYGSTSIKEKPELVKYVFSDFDFKFTPAVALVLLENADSVKTAKMVLDRSSIETWNPGDSDIFAFFTGSVSYRNKNVQNYVQNVVSKIFERMGKKDAETFFNRVYDAKVVLFYTIKKRSLSSDDVAILYNRLLRIGSNSDDDRTSYSIQNLLKAILRYHPDKPNLVATFLINMANADYFYESLSSIKIIVKHFNGNIPYVIFKEINQILLGGLTSYSTIQTYTSYIIEMVNLMLNTNPSSFYVDNTVTYVMELFQAIGSNSGQDANTIKAVDELYEKIMRVLKVNLSDRAAIDLQRSYINFWPNARDSNNRIKKVINYIISARRNTLNGSLIFNILSAAKKVGGDYFEDMIGTVIDLQKSKLTRHDAIQILQIADNKQAALNKLKDYIDNNWLKLIIPSIQPDLTIQETMIKYSDYFINETKTHGTQIDLQKAFNVFDASYKKATGNSWDFNKFASRAHDWTFFGDDHGYVAVREQRSGMVKLVGTAGSPKSVISGFREMTTNYTGKAIWGAVSLDIATMLERLDPNFKAMRVPGGIAGKILFKALKTMIPANVFGGAQIKDVNADGTITFEYNDVGEANKVMVGNKEYFDFLKNQILTDPRLSSYAPMLSKLF